ncbi:MAG TPA: DmsC/YnfH family molybdoenzyme membrane anchor subunit [Casimicrobiaceae bacterium]|nr:DmsC/YnfH family molybdoenzyme membrane anchor subunit [Casimicrobiaceae bacterium]
MNPKFSVILLTTLIGAGQGLFVAVFAVEVAARFNWLPSPIRPWFFFYGALVAFAFTAAGLVASFFHLGRPERAWRSTTKWRTSWLSREVIALPAFMAVAIAYALAHFLGWNGTYGSAPESIMDPTVLLGAVGSVLAFALYVCTGMIYACLPFLREWATPLTVINYMLLGLASGFTLAAAATLAAGAVLRFIATAALVLTVIALVGRAASLYRNARLRPKSTLQTAIGVKHPRIVQKSQGFMGGSFNTREFFHGRATATLRGVKWLFLLFTFVVPAAALAAGLAGGPRIAFAIAFVVQYVGLLAERWYFFAQANHPQNLYYQAIA